MKAPGPEVVARLNEPGAREEVMQRQCRYTAEPEPLVALGAGAALCAAVEFV